MQANKLKDVKETLVGDILTDFILTMGLCASLSDVEDATLKMVQQALSLVSPGKKIVDTAKDQQQKALAESDQDTLQIEVRSQPERNDFLKVPCTFLVKQVKEMIKDKSGYPIELQQLCFEDQIL